MIGAHLNLLLGNVSMDSGAQWLINPLLDVTGWLHLARIMSQYCDCVTLPSLRLISSTSCSSPAPSDKPCVCSTVHQTLPFCAFLHHNSKRNLAVNWQRIQIPRPKLASKSSQHPELLSQMQRALTFEWIEMHKLESSVPPQLLAGQIYKTFYGESVLTHLHTGERKTFHFWLQPIVRILRSF